MDNIITVPKYKSKTRNYMRMLIKMNELFRYYDCRVLVSASDLPEKEIIDYLSTFHDIEDYGLIQTKNNTIIIWKKTGDNDSKEFKLEYGDSDTELPLKEEVEPIEETPIVKPSEDPIEQKHVIHPSASRTRQIMAEVNEKLYKIDSWKMLDENGCCTVSIGNIKPEDEIDFDYIKTNISHSGVRHKCLDVDIMKTSNNKAIIVVLTWKE